MSILSRLFRIGKAEANSAIDKIEDPVKMTDQIIRELKETYQEAIKGEAQVKAIALQHRAEESKSREKASEWEKKANDLLDMIDDGKLDESKGNELAAQAAKSAQDATNQANEYAKMAEKEEKAISVMDAKIKQIKDRITETESRAGLIKSRAKTAEASEKINKTLSNIDTDGLMGTLDRMEQKVSASEFLAQAYAEVSDIDSTSQEIDKVLSSSTSNDALEALKSKRQLKNTKKPVK